MHISVLFHEVIEALNPQPGKRFIDGTFGAGGHTKGLLEEGAQVLAFDRDHSTLDIRRKKFVNYADTQLKYVHANYSEMGDLAPPLGYDQVDGILLDIGVSSMQFDQAERGFSFAADGPLDMRMNRDDPTTAADLINGLPEENLAEIFFKYGEERNSRKIAKAIGKARERDPFTRTAQLAAVVETTVPKPSAKQRRKRTHKQIHPATRVFQALRIAVNRELEELERGLDAAISLLKSGGRLAVISFHSLEDRIVKQTFRKLSDPYYNQPEHVMHIDTSHIVLKRITRKPLVATPAEIESNPRSRSAKLRVAEKL
ncbi:MAG: 16S rRNA (cytosine(1402)-N(4))-methyltransferase RsmH [Chloroflexota bacterium]